MTTTQTKRVLTHSSVAQARMCLRAWQYRNELHLVADTDAEALHVGSAVHRGIELWRLTQPGLRTPTRVGEILQQVLDDYPNDQNPYATSMAMACLSAYFERWSGIDDFTQWPHVEVTFETAMVNPSTGGASRTFELSGKIDAISDECPWETKTTGEDIAPGSNYMLRLRNDPQISTYLNALRKLGYDYSFIRYDVVRKPGLRPRSVPIVDEHGDKIVLDGDGVRVLNKNGLPRQSADIERGYELQTRPETPEEYCDRLVDAMLAEPDKHFARIDVYRPDDALESHEADLWQTGQMLLQCLNAGQFPRSINRWTCGFCSYAPLCLNNITVDPAIVAPTGYRFENPNHELEDSV